MVARKIMGGWVMLRLRLRVVILLHRKVLQRRRNGGEGEKGRALGHKLNILDGLTNKIILMVTTSVILSV